MIVIVYLHNKNKKYILRILFKYLMMNVEKPDTLGSKRIRIQLHVVGI